MHSLRIGFVLLVLGLFAARANAQLTPDKALASLQVAEGLQVELFASEPMVVNPTSMDIDERGRVWITEAVNYRRKNFGRPILRPEGDRIVVLVDKDSDGKANESVVFYQGQDLYGPLGIAIAPYPNPKAKDKVGYKVFVCQSPDILLFEDADGDLKADGPPKKFLTGFQGFDHDHGVHGINIGPDGKFYFTVGDAGVKDLQSSDGKGKKFTSNATDCRAGTVWRCDQDGTHLEQIAHNFRNNYECCVNSFGDIWLSDNDDDGNQQTRICFVMPGGDYGYHPRGPGQSHWHEEQPGVVHKALRTGFGSPTGICFYEGTLLPKKYQGQLLHTDAGPRELRCFHLKPQGAGFEVEKENLITSSDNWFRLSDVCVAPDGSVFVCDWYDPGVGGHGMGDWTRGRVYRLTPKGHKGYKVPEVKLDSMAEKSQALFSPCLATHSLGLASFKGANVEVISNWTKELGDRLKNPLIEARMTWVFPFVDPTPSVALLCIKEFGSNPHESIRTFALRLAQIYRSRLDEVPFDEQFMKYVLRSGPAVHREALLWMGLLDPQRVKPVIDSLAKLYDGKDRFYLAALNIACGTDPKRRDEILKDFDKQFPEWNDKVADLVWELRPASMMPKLGQMLEDPKFTAKQKGRIVDILAASDDLSAGKSLLALLKPETPAPIRDEAIKNLRLFLPTKWKALATGKEMKETIEGMLKSPGTVKTGLGLVAAAGSPEWAERVGDLFLKEKDLEVRREALKSLSKLRSVESVAALDESMCHSKDPLAAESALALGGLVAGPAKDDVSQRALNALQKKLDKDGDRGGPLVTAILNALAGSRQGTNWLLGLKEEGKLPANLIAETGRMLRNSPFAIERNKAMLVFPAPGKLDPKKLPPITELAKRTGSVERGKKLLAATLTNEAQCLKCHTVHGQGGQIGPDLSMIGKKAAGKENLLESILNPNKAIADQFVQWQVTTDSGATVTGLIVEETETEITVRDANGTDTKIPVKEIENRKKSLVSIMPDNLVNNMTENDLIDLTEYLLSLKTPSLTPDYWHIIGPFKGGAIDTPHAPELRKGIDLGVGYEGKSGKVDWKTVKPDGKGYVDLATHYGTEATDTTSYLIRDVESPKDQDATILLGNDDECIVRVNNDAVFTNRDHLAATPERHKIPVKLKKGSNRILIKINNGNSPHGLYFTLTSEEELKLAK